MLHYFDQCIFYNVHSIDPVNLCTNFEIDRNKIDKFRKHAKIMTHDAKTVRRTSLLDTSDSYSDQKIWKPIRNPYDFRLKSYGSNSGFCVFGDLDHCSIFLSHTLGIKYWNHHAKFHKNPSSMNGWYATDTHTNTHIKGQINSLANPFRARLKTTKYGD